MKLPAASATLDQLRRLAAYNVLEDRAYTSEDASETLASYDANYKPNWQWAETNKSIIESAYKKSLRKRIGSLKRKLQAKTLSREDKKTIEEDWGETDEALGEFLDELEMAKDDFKERVDFWWGGGLGSWAEELRKKPTKTQWKACITELDQTHPGWEEDDSEVIINALMRKFPELDPRTAPSPQRSRGRATPRQSGKSGCVVVFASIVVIALGAISLAAWI